MSHEVPKSQGFKSELSKIWLDTYNQELTEESVLPSSVIYECAKDLVWRLPKTIALSVSYAAKHTNRWVKRQIASAL